MAISEVKAKTAIIQSVDKVESGGSFRFWKVAIQLDTNMYYIPVYLGESVSKAELKAGALSALQEEDEKPNTIVSNRNAYDMGEGETLG
jgi:hypothetical protein